MRNVLKDIERAEHIISTYRAVRVGEVLTIRETYSDPYNYIIKGFMFGFMVGYRQGKDEKHDSKIK